MTDADTGQVQPSQPVPAQTRPSLVVKSTGGTFSSAQLLYDGKPLDIMLTRIDVTVRAGAWNQAVLYVDGIEIEDLEVSDENVSAVEGVVKAQGILRRRSHFLHLLEDARKAGIDPQAIAEIIDMGEHDGVPHIKQLLKP